MRYNFDRLPDRRRTENAKWNQYAPDILPLWVADMDFPSPEPVVRALRQRVEHGYFGYPPSGLTDAHSFPEFRRLLVERMEKLYGWQVLPEEIVFVPGVVVGFTLACHALAAPGGEVLAQTPVYPHFLHAPEQAGMQQVDVELSRGPDGVYHIDFQAFEKAISGNTRLFILCNPHNPIGRVFTRDELARLAEICLRRGVTICSDEVHSDLLFPGHRHIPLASLDAEIAQHTITLIAPSKTFNIAGLQCAVAVIQNAGLREQFIHANKGLVGWNNLLGMVAGQAAYAEGQEWLDQLLVYLQANRDFLSDFVREALPGISMSPVEGTYLAWLDCREAGIEGNPFQFFMEKGRVALSDGAAFGRGGQGFVRLNFGCPRAMLAEALQRMQAALEKKPLAL